MRLILLVSVWSLSTLVWADQTITPGKDIDLVGLTTEVKQVVPSLEGMHERQQDGTMTFRRLGGGAFTQAEQAALAQAAQAHDAPKSRERQRSSSEDTEIPLESFGAGAAGALAALGGKNLVLRAMKKRGVV